MNDQARQLRELVIQDAFQCPDQESDHPTNIWFCSGQAGVGTTTVALNVAVALARMGLRVVFVAAPGDNAGTAPFDGLFEPLARQPQEPIHGSLQVGPFGLNLFVPSPDPSRGRPPLHQIADFVLIDAGWSDRPWWAAEDVGLYVYVTTVDNASILDTYALMKSQQICGGGYVIANQVEAESEGWNALERFCAASDDYSDRRISPTAVIPQDPSGQLALNARPVVLQSPTSALAKCFERVAERLCESSHRARSSSEGRQTLKRG